MDGLALFLAAALVVALTPGPGILYVAARTMAGGKGEGFASTLGTGIGGLVHVAAGAAGVSALVLASAEAFAILKFAGAVYLVWLGVKTMRAADFAAPEVAATGVAKAFREGVVVEALNPKTAAFFLAFLPQFVDVEAGGVARQFAALGAVSVFLNTAVDFAVVFAADRARAALVGRAHAMRRVRQASGAAICGLGVLLAFARRP